MTGGYLHGFLRVGLYINNENYSEAKTYRIACWLVNHDTESYWCQITSIELWLSPQKLMLTTMLVLGIKSPDTGSFYSGHRTPCSNHCVGPAPHFRYFWCLSEFQCSVCRGWSILRRDGQLTLQSPCRINENRDRVNHQGGKKQEGRTAREVSKLFFCRRNKSKFTSSFLWLLQNFPKQNRPPGRWWWDIPASRLSLGQRLLCTPCQKEHAAKTYQRIHQVHNEASKMLWHHTYKPVICRPAQLLVHHGAKNPLCAG